MDNFYIPDLDTSVIPINYITTVILENNKKKNEKKRLENLDPSQRIQTIWQEICNDGEMRDCLDIDQLWKKPSLMLVDKQYS